MVRRWSSRWRKNGARASEEGKWSAEKQVSGHSAICSEVSGEDSVEEGSGAGRERPPKHVLASQPHAMEHRRGQPRLLQGPLWWPAQPEQKERENGEEGMSSARRGIEDPNYFRIEEWQKHGRQNEKRQSMFQRIRIRKGKKKRNYKLRGKEGKVRLRPGIKQGLLEQRDGSCQQVCGRD